jgi:hypothetical protein
MTSEQRVLVELQVGGGGEAFGLFEAELRCVERKSLRAGPGRASRTVALGQS